MNYASRLSAGLDVLSEDETLIPAGKSVRVKVKPVDTSFDLVVLPKSGLQFKKHITAKLERFNLEDVELYNFSGRDVVMPANTQVAQVVRFNPYSGKSVVRRSRELYATQDVSILPGGCATIVTQPTRMVHNECGVVWPNNVGPHNIGLGLVDSDYTGEVAVLVANEGPDMLRVKKGQSVAYIEMAGYLHLDNYEVKDIERGNRGFGELD